jgi:hypothetical protein
MNLFAYAYLVTSLLAQPSAAWVASWTHDGLDMNGNATTVTEFTLAVSELGQDINFTPPLDQLTVQAADAATATGFETNIDQLLTGRLSPPEYVIWLRATNAEGSSAWTWTSVDLRSVPPSMPANMQVKIIITVGG